MLADGQVTGVLRRVTCSVAIRKKLQQTAEVTSKRNESKGH